ncbi:restriction endonuclease [Bacillus cereus]|uniref:restriction endonuclease n=1 Tax=Bacillus cereus TaxID=1396 RepID=UPI0027B92901|nr:restriction endonuclease [Bacillus cereus]
MNGRHFEEYLSSLYQSLGYQTEVIKSSVAFGADLILKNNGKKIVAPAKRYKSKVRIQSVQEVVGTTKVLRCYSCLGCN